MPRFSVRNRVHKRGCFRNPRTGVRMKALGGRRGFRRCR